MTAVAASADDVPPSFPPPPSYSTTLLTPPSPPQLHVDPYTLPRVLDERLLDEVLLPRCPAEAGSPYLLLGLADRVWTKQLELWYQTVHLDVWRLLVHDDNADCKYVNLLTTRYKLDRKQPSRAFKQLAKEEQECLKKAYRHALCRTRQRFRRIYSLYLVRWSWLRSKRSLELSEEVLLSQLPPCEPSLLPPYRPGSVWPLPAPTSPSAGAMFVGGFMVPFCEVPS